MAAAVWEKCVTSLQQELPAQQFNTWIRPLTLEQSHDASTEFCLLAPNRFILDWVSDKFLHRIKELVEHFFAQESLPVPQEVVVKVSNQKPAAFQAYDGKKHRQAQNRESASLNTFDASANPQDSYNSQSADEHDIQLQNNTATAPIFEPDIPNTDINMRSSFNIDNSEETINTTEGNASFGGITSNTLSGNHVSPYSEAAREQSIPESFQSPSPHKPLSRGALDSQSFSHHDYQSKPSPSVSNPSVNTEYVEGGLKHRNGLNKAFTFESFVEGKSNQMGLAAAQQVVENPGGSYNPLFIYGGVGLGKTHLMHAVGNEMAKRNPNAKIVYLHSERFVADMVKALQLNAINDFKRYYRSVDALLIDDIQFFAGKDRSQEEFFHTFNALLEGNQQIILTCDRYPKVIHNLEERLKSRFGWGLTIEVEPPELETRVAILLKRAEEVKIDLSYDAAFFIAQRIRSNVRELEGALKRVIANATFTQREISVELVREALKDLIALQDKQVSISNIQRVVGEYYKVKVADLLSKRRSRSVARPRQMAMALAKELTNHSLPEIGDAFGGRDHTTVLHACRKIKELCDTDTDINQDLKNLQRL